MGVLLAGCGGGAAPSAAAPPTPSALIFNQADVGFAAHMSQHHGQALQLSELAQRRARSAAVRALADELTEARAPEVDQLAGWLARWGEAGGEMPPHGVRADHGVPGLLAEEDVERLVATPPRRFDSLFLDLMVRHHRGGTQITRAQIAHGRNLEALELARRSYETARSRGYISAVVGHVTTPAAVIVY